MSSLDGSSASMEGSFCDGHAGEWSVVKTLHIGPAAPGTPRRYLLVSRDEVPWLRICLDSDRQECMCFEGFLYWEEALWIGFGSRVVRIELPTLKIEEVLLDGYFGSFHLLPDSLLACSASQVHRFAPSGETLWTSPTVGIDGVLVSQVQGSVIEGEGEWDPPGGWDTFRLSLESGEFVG